MVDAAYVEPEVRLEMSKSGSIEASLEGGARERVFAQCEQSWSISRTPTCNRIQDSGFRIQEHINGSVH